ncbi:MAG: phosphoribosylamine--glycine ligase [Nitrospiria bacterium]
MRILVIGSGGREHALVWKIAQSPSVTKLYCAPGNPGMAALSDLASIPVDDIDGLLRFVGEQGIDLTVVGPELPLSLGIVDRFEEKGLKIFGPSRAAAQIESSKVFSKRLMEKYGVPTARAEVVGIEDAYGRVTAMDLPVVLKVDGLAAGKGVVIAHTEKEVEEGLDFLRSIGDAATEMIIEQFLEGVEASFFVVTDGVHAIPVGTAQDHKAVFNGNRGPNTGGMGVVSPSPRMTPALEAEIMSKVIEPTLSGMAKEGMPYKGMLYAGLMLTDRGVYVLEYNARWGDPEAQALLPRLKTDWVDTMLASIEGRLDSVQIDWEGGGSVCVVLASGGYPGPYKKGEPISGLDGDFSDSLVFHAGTKRPEGQWQTSGGRVLGVTAVQPTVSEARQQAYQTIAQISFPGMHFRTDIAQDVP